MDSGDYWAWAPRPAHERASWQPAKLRTVLWWDSMRWPAVLGEAGLAAFGVLLLAIRRPERAP